MCGRLRAHHRDLSIARLVNEDSKKMGPVVAIVPRVLPLKLDEYG